jgi:hypothetical protein
MSKSCRASFDWRTGAKAGNRTQVSSLARSRPAIGRLLHGDPGWTRTSVFDLRTVAPFHLGLEIKVLLEPPAGFEPAHFEVETRCSFPVELRGLGAPGGIQTPDHDVRSVRSWFTRRRVQKFLGWLLRQGAGQGVSFLESIWF